MLRAVGSLARADFLERVRRHAFLVTLGVTVYAAYVFLPPEHAAYVTLRMGNHRGIYNSAWVGSAVAMLATSFLSFAGFYLVKNSVERDRRTGVGQILAAAPISKAAYTAGKALSNFAVLAAMVAVVALAAGAMQLVLGEDRRLDVAALLLPFAFVALPAMAVIAGLAVLFECVPALRGGLGNVVYFFAWGAAISVPAMRASSGQAFFDPLGLALVVPDMLRACEAAFPDFSAASGQYSMGFNFPASGTWRLETFRWEGVDWRLVHVLPRLFWMGVGVSIALVAAIPFDRFDAARSWREPRPGRAPRGGWIGAAATRLGGRIAAPWGRGQGGRSGPGAAVEPRATLPAPVGRSFSFLTLVRAELGLLLKGPSPWWYAVALGLVVACLLAPLEVARGKLLAFAWVWPMLRWSTMGIRERRHATEELVFSSPRPLLRQLPAQWLAGVLVAMLAGAGAGLRLGLAGEWEALGGWTAGALFVPSLALALGVWSGSGKLFEVIYLLLWWAGPISELAAVDYTGTTAAALEAGSPARFLAAAPILFVLAVAARRLRARG